MTLVVSLGGEGEVVGAVDTNTGFVAENASQLWSSIEEIRARNPNRQVAADMRQLPYADGAAAEVVGRHVPPHLLANFAPQIAAEMVRVLERGGTTIINSRSPVFAPTAPARTAFEQLGFNFPNENTAKLIKPRP